MEKFNSLLIELKNSNVLIEENNFDQQIELSKYTDYDETYEDVFTDTGMVVPENDRKYLAMDGLRFVWSNEGNGDSEYLYGSCFIGGVASALVYPSHFWKVYNNPTPNSKEEEELNKIACFQRSAHGDDGAFGCYYREAPKYPCDIYFYDNGVYCPMNMTLDEYFDALIASKAVALWQYFYLEPEAIVKMLDGLHCNKWISLYDKLEGNPTRVEGVITHMERVIRLFPGLFPDHDLTYFKSRLEKLKKFIGK